MADVPHDSVVGSFTNSTPAAFSSAAVPCTSSVSNEMFMKLPIHVSWPGAVKRTTPVSARGMRSSIHRVPGPIGASVETLKPSFSV